MSESKPKRTRIIGVDYGMARLGLAASDETKMIASPLPTLKAEKRLEQTIDKLLQFLTLHQAENRYEIEALVVGMPLMMSGKYGLLADEVKLFAEMLRRQVAFQVITWDERLTTVQAERALRETSMTRKKRSQNVDSVAALIILQNYLDHKLMQR